MNQCADDAKRMVAAFLEYCGCDFEFPAGGKKELLSSAEANLYSLLESETLSDADRIRLMSDGLEWSACYSIVVFGVRLAIFAARNADPAPYRQGLRALAAGGPRVDWRDVLAALAIFENCANRLGVNFRDELEAVVTCSEETALRSTIDAYLSRSDDMRTVEVMGLVESGTGKELTFRAKAVF